MAYNWSIVDCTGPSGDIAFRFVILDAPSPSTLPMYVKELVRLKVRRLVRVCGQTYKSDIVEKSGIATHGFPFDDGAPPPPSVIDSWLSLLELDRKGGSPTPQKDQKGGDETVGPVFPIIAVHCVAGLGRAPILVALALVEFGGMQPLDAIGLVRSKRKGAINQVQLNWLSRYKPRSHGGGSKLECCTVQ